MAKIQEFTFGSIVLEGKRYRRGIPIFANGSVKKRQGGFLMFGSHEIKKRELEQLSQGQPEAMIIGTGTNGAAHIASEAQSRARQRSLNLLVQPSYDAVAKLNELIEQQKKVAALIDITC